MLRLAVREHAENDILGFRPEGRAVRVRMLERLPEASEPTLLVIDFQNMRIIASSPLDELTFVLRDTLRSAGSPYFPVFANLPPWHEELNAVSVVRGGDSLPLCELDDSNRVNRAWILGELDEAQKLTLRALHRLGEATGALLHQCDADGRQTSATAWNNRLAYLARKGLVIERVEGRSKFYRPVLSELEG